MSNPLPTLSTSGFVRQPAEKIDFALSHFVYADGAQSSLYGSNVSSLQVVLERNSGSIDATVSDLKNTLQSYLQKYFDSVSIDAKYSEEDSSSSMSKINIQLSIVVTVDQVEYEVTKVIKTINGRFKEFINLNNG